MAVASSSRFPEQADLVAAEEKEAPWQRFRLLMLTHHVWLISGVIGVVMFISSLGLDLLLLKYERAPLALVASNSLVGLLAAVLVFTLLAYGRAQRRRIEQRMEALQEVNHHIRNALQALAFAAAALKDRKESAAISDAIARIHWALSEVLPRVEPAYEPFEGSARQASEHNLLRPDPDKPK